jgi:hypothetical protein
MCVCVCVFLESEREMCMGFCGICCVCMCDFERKDFEMRASLVSSLNFFQILPKQSTLLFYLSLLKSFLHQTV